MPATPALRALSRETARDKTPLRAVSTSRHLLPVPPLPDTGEADRGEIPAPAPGFVRALAVQGYEVLAGRRNPTQLGPLVSVALARRLVVMRAVWNDRRLVYRDHRGHAPRAAGVRIDQADAAVAEASVVLHVGSRVCAVALRLEWVHQHWRACELIVL